MMVRRICALSIVLGLVLGGCLGAVDELDDAADPAPVGDPTEDGIYGVELFEYDFGLSFVLGEPAQPYPVQMRGSVHLPVDAPPAKVVVFMHGRHATCDLGVTEFLVPLCPDTPVSASIRSYQGYDYLGAHLASHGYAVISLDANGVNDLDMLSIDAGGRARGELVLQTLDAFRARNTSAAGSPAEDGIGAALVGRLDLSAVGLMGHSRGGEGVVQAALQNEARTSDAYPLRAVFALAPIDAMGSRLTGVPFATLLPYCDGDVVSLSGARIYDASVAAAAGDAASRYQILVLGANHNAFNTLWTFDDGRSPDPYCQREGPSGALGSGRITAEEQRALGVAYIGGFLRLYVGDEADLASFFDADVALDEALCPLPDPCDDKVHMSYHPPAVDRIVLESGARFDGTNDLDGAAAFTGDGVSVTTCTAPGCPLAPTRGSAAQLVVTHSGQFTYKTQLPPGSRDLSGHPVLSFRAALGGDPDAPVRVQVSLEDGNGTDIVVATKGGALFVPPGDAAEAYVLNDVVLKLRPDAGTGFDMRDVRTLRVTVEAGPGTVQLADLMFRR